MLWRKRESEGGERGLVIASKDAEGRNRKRELKVPAATESSSSPVSFSIDVDVVAQTWKKNLNRFVFERQKLVIGDNDALRMSSLQEQRQSHSFGNFLTSFYNFC